MSERKRDTTGASSPPRFDFTSSVEFSESLRPLVMGRSGAVSSGHYLASLAGMRMFDLEGTAIDAGIAAGVCISVLLFPRADFGGVAPIILHNAESRRTVTLDGLGVWPESTDLGYLQTAGDDATEGIFRAVTPGAPDAWLMALAEFGTLTVGDVLEPAQSLAEQGAPVSTGVARDLGLWEEAVAARYPTTYRAFYPEGRVLRAGDIIHRPELGRVLKSLMDAEAAARARGADRKEAIRAARDVFYRGWIAEAINDFFEEQGGWIRKSDLANHAVEVADPVLTTYRGYDVYSCGPWCQGPVLLQCLNILENFDLKSLGHNTGPYLHLLIESIDRAYADRESYYGDPRAVPVPLQGMLSKEFAAARARTIDLERATGEASKPGDPWQYETFEKRPETVFSSDVSQYAVSSESVDGRLRIDTSYCAAIDHSGNVFSATPSDPSMWGPVIPALGFPCSGRGVQSRVDPAHPASAGAGRRPRLTPNPALVGVDGEVKMGFGCPGGDIQPQGMLQVFLNLAEFGMNLQQAIEAPRIMSWNFPNSFAPHRYYPGRVDIESRVSEDVRTALRAQGHVGDDTEDYFWKASAVHAVAMATGSGVLVAAADPRVEGAALAW